MSVAIGIKTTKGAEKSAQQKPKKKKVKKDAK